MAANPIRPAESRYTPRASSPGTSREVLPLTPEMVAILRARAASAHAEAKGCGIAVGAVAVVFAGLSLTRIVSWDPVVVIFAGVSAVLFAMHLAGTDGQSCAADVEAGIYVRLTGPLTLYIVEHEEGAPDHHFWVRDQDFSIDASTFEDLRPVRWATVEYAPVSRTRFALYDETGRVWLQHPRYVPDVRARSPAVPPRADPARRPAPPSRSRAAPRRTAPGRAREWTLPARARRRRRDDAPFLWREYQDEPEEEL